MALPPSTIRLVFVLVAVAMIIFGGWEGYSAWFDQKNFGFTMGGLSLLGIMILGEIRDIRAATPIRLER